MLGVMSKEPRKPGRPRSPDSGKKSGDRHKNKRRTFAIPDDLLEAIDTYRNQQEVAPDVSAVIRAALREFLKSRDLWPPKGDAAAS